MKIGYQYILRAGRLASLLMLGIILPAILLMQAYQAMGKMSDITADGNDIASVINALPASVQELQSNNDYALLSISLMEASNQRTMLVKQRMKISVMHIGFAVISFGLMLLVLGLEAGGVDIAATATQGSSINLKTTSTSVTAVLLGAAMAAAGALVPNQYTTVSIPSYAYVAAKPAANGKLDQLGRWAKECIAGAKNEARASCFQNAIAETLSE